MPYIIGLAGQAGAGKNVVADYLVHNLNKSGKNKWSVGSFANNVKRIFSETFGVSRDFIEHWKRIDNNPPGLNKSMRECLTFIGDGFRQIRSTIWMDLLLNDLKGNLVIADVRYLNEVTRIRKEGGYNVLLWRQGHENNIQNASEQELMPLVKKYKDKPSGELKDEPFDFWLKNDGTIEELFEKVTELILPKMWFADK